MTVVRVALVGSGSAARQHLEAVQTLDNIKVTTISDPLLHGSGPPWASDVRFTDVETVFDDDSVDIISVCTPPGTHARFVVRALRAGKAVVVEKPVATSLAEFELILQEQKLACLPVAVMHQHRFSLPTEILAVEWSNETFACVEVFKYRPLAYFESANWRTNQQLAAGGCFAHLGIHYSDLACQLLGIPTEIAGLVGCDFHSGIDTRVLLAMRFESGASLNLICSCLPIMRSERLTVRDRQNFFQICDGHSVMQGLNIEEKHWEFQSKSRSRAAVYEETATCLRLGKHHLPRSDVAKARGVMAMVDAVRELANHNERGQVTYRHQHDPGRSK